jgi:hypothetical protein
MFLIKQIIIIITLIISGCGGGGGSPGTPMGSDKSETSNSNSEVTGASNGSDPLPTADDFNLVFDKLNIKNSGSDKATITVTALDSNNNVVAGVPVNVKVDKATFTPTAKVTDKNGNYSGDIGIGQDKSNRTVTVTISMGSVTKSGAVYITGAVIAANLMPANPTPGSQVSLDLSVKDSVNNPIPFAMVIFSGDFGFSGRAIANESGTITKTITAPTIPGLYKLGANAMGVIFNRDIQVIQQSKVDGANGMINSANLSVNPTELSPNLNGSNINRATLRAKFLTNANLGIKNVRVQFRITSNPLSGESISVGDGIVYTDENGEATAYYIPGSASSPTDGVEIIACYKTSDFVATELQNNCAKLPTSGGGITSLKKLTIASEAVSIAISDYDKLEKGPSGIDYLEKLLIQVTDAAGRGVQNAVVSASVDITHYGKGTYADNYILGYIPPPASYLSQDGISPAVVGKRIWCVNEDTNRNHSIDKDEDKNKNGRLDPEQAAISFTSVDGENTTDANGQAFIKVSYGQKFATWLAYTVTVTTAVKGSEGRTSMRFISQYLDGDKTTGAFLTPPYGTGTCDSPN